MKKNNKFTFIDLFAGIGGFRMALDRLGGDCVNFSEISKDAVNTYCTNFNDEEESNLGDITKIKELKSHNLLTGGVPCQSWSIAGRNLGFDDDRGQLWNDTIYLLNQSRPDAFIFENVKGLVDPRNREALSYILDRIKEAGYFADYHVLNSFDFGIPQNRVRIYIIGFKEERFYKQFRIPKPLDKKIKLGEVIFNLPSTQDLESVPVQKNLFGETVIAKSMSLSSNNGFNDYFLFNDLRNGHSTIHSWDILETTERQKEICYFLLKNRRKSIYGNLDGNPLSVQHFKQLDASIEKSELDSLVELGILKTEEYSFEVKDYKGVDLSTEEQIVLSLSIGGILSTDVLKLSRELKVGKISFSKTLKSLKEKNVVYCSEIRYDFKNTKISTGLFGVNRIFLPTSDIYPTLVASDTNDFVSTIPIKAKSEDDYKNQFLEKVYKTKDFRKITKEEACLIQGFPSDYILPESRPRWMKLIGNSVSVPVIEALGRAIIDTGVFDDLNPAKNGKKLENASIKS